MVLARGNEINISNIFIKGPLGFVLGECNSNGTLLSHWIARLSYTPFRLGYAKYRHLRLFWDGLVAVLGCISADIAQCDSSQHFIMNSLDVEVYH